MRMAVRSVLIKTPTDTHTHTHTHTHTQWRDTVCLALTVKNSYPESEAGGKGKEKGCKEQFGKEEDTADTKADGGGGQKVKVEMFTWDSSGCMSKESVSIMYYQRHTNRLIEKSARN